MRIIICSGKQALHQDKFHPPSKQPIAAHLPPFLKQTVSVVQGILTSHMAMRLPVYSVGFEDREARQNALSALRLQLYQRTEMREKEDRDRDSQNFMFYIGLILLQADPILSSDFLLRNTTSTWPVWLNQRLPGTCTVNEEMIHKHLQKWARAAKPVCQWGQRKSAYLQGLNGSSMTNRLWWG